MVRMEERSDIFLTLTWRIVSTITFGTRAAAACADLRSIVPFTTEVVTANGIGIGDTTAHSSGIQSLLMKEFGSNHWWTLNLCNPVVSIGVGNGNNNSKNKKG